jgi:hypothetical protein
MSGLPAAGVGDAPALAAPAQPTGYAGLATRVVSFAIDAALITIVDVIIGVGAALILSLLHIPHGREHDRLRCQAACRSAGALSDPPRSRRRGGGRALASIRGALMPNGPSRNPPAPIDSICAERPSADLSAGRPSAERLALAVVLTPTLGLRNAVGITRCG